MRCSRAAAALSSLGFNSSFFLALAQLSQRLEIRTYCRMAYLIERTDIFLRQRSKPCRYLEPPLTCREFNEETLSSRDVAKGGDYERQSAFRDQSSPNKIHCRQ